MLTLRKLRSADTLPTVQTQSDARFLIQNVPPGSYELLTRAIGYRARRDTLNVDADSGRQVQIRLAYYIMCLGECPPDATRLAALRARRGEWGCTLAPGSVQEGLHDWLDLLEAHNGQAAAELHLPADTTRLRKQVIHIGDRSVCQAAAAAFDRIRGVGDLRTLVFKVGKFYLVSQYEEHMMVFDRRWRVVVYYVWQ
jgi:hypothetical protein